MLASRTSPVFSAEVTNHPRSLHRVSRNLDSAVLQFNSFYKFLSNKKFLLGQAAEPSGPEYRHVRFFTYLSAAIQDKQNHQ